MRGDFLSPSDVVPVRPRSSSHRESRKNSPSAKYMVVMASSFILPTCVQYRTSASQVQALGYRDLHGLQLWSNSLLLPPLQRSAGEGTCGTRTGAQPPAGQGSRNTVKVSSTLNCVESLPCNFGIIQSHIKLEWVCCLSCYITISFLQFSC